MSDDSDSEEIKKTLSIRDRKLDVMNRYVVAMKQTLEAISSDIQISRNSGRASRKICLPVENDAGLLELEEFSKLQQGEDALRERIRNESFKTLYDFLRNMVKLLFGRTCHFTWTGKSAHNAQYAKVARSASELHIIELLIEVAQEKFAVDKNRAETEFIRALHNFNESIALSRKRKNELSTIWKIKKNLVIKFKIQ
ncbi:uncharacterized protein LOC129771208 [Toxorhynchites rutilus septentrionalis]|uniref:uncharacterized protein LOC129771208 n=1 Tax=Toxorhynchites rutilus septentrionalis TaxID=329112 RepID=UPI00247A4F86|nr:uncharacterized protein LOC129771208 [Toxorhynchites rutilus septentrionalis]